MTTKPTIGTFGRMLTVSVLVFSLFGVLAQSQPPRSLPQKYSFSQYHVSVIRIERKAEVIIPKEAATDANEIKTSYLKRNVDFAGKYVFIPLSCGMGCEGGGLVDAVTGKAYPLPGGVSTPPDIDDDNFKRIDYRVDSRLMILTGNVNEQDTHPGNLVRHYYVFDGDIFKAIGTDVLTYDTASKTWRRAAHQ